MMIVTMTRFHYLDYISKECVEGHMCPEVDGHILCTRVNDAGLDLLAKGNPLEGLGVGPPADRPGQVPARVGVLGRGAGVAGSVGCDVESCQVPVGTFGRGVVGKWIGNRCGK